MPVFFLSGRHESPRVGFLKEIWWIEPLLLSFKVLHVGMHEYSDFVHAHFGSLSFFLVFLGCHLPMFVLLWLNVLKRVIIVRKTPNDKR